jgi:hypothetical protein
MVMGCTLSVFGASGWTHCHEWGNTTFYCNRTISLGETAVFTIGVWTLYKTIADLTEHVIEETGNSVPLDNAFAGGK